MIVRLVWMIIPIVFFGIIGIQEAFAHGGGPDDDIVVDLGGKQVVLRVSLSPSDITVGETNEALMKIRFFEQETEENFESVTYRVELFRDGELLARQLFFDFDGELEVKIRPVHDCFESKKISCTKYFGSKEPITGGLYDLGGIPVIQGPIFDKGGLHHIKVDIECINNPKCLANDVLSFDAYVSVAQEQNFDIIKAGQVIPVIIKTYYDDVANFVFDGEFDSIKFDMPFNWNPAFANEVTMIHEEVRVPKSFKQYDGIDFTGFVNGVELVDRSVILDPYSDENSNIVHFLVTGAEIKRINEELGEEHHDNPKILFELIPQNKLQTNSFQINLDSGAHAIVQWDSVFSPGSTIPFDISFFDKHGNLLRDTKYGYSIEDQTGQILVTNNGQEGLGIFALEGIDTQYIGIPDEQDYKIKLAIFDHWDIPDDSASYIGIGEKTFQLGGDNSDNTIPQWIKVIAQAWSNDQISEGEFVQAIQFLIKENIITVQKTEQTNSDVTEIPVWIKNTAKWWADGSISDGEFTASLQHLIMVGVIRV